MFLYLFFFETLEFVKPSVEQTLKIGEGETYEKMVLPVLSPDPNTDVTWSLKKIVVGCGLVGG